MDQRTDDAYVRADMTPMSTRVSGTVRKINVNDFEAVKPGQLLVELEDDDYRAVLQEAQAALASAKAELEDNQAAKRIQEAKIQSAEASVIQAVTAVNAAKAGVDAVNADAERTQLELKRQQALLAAKAATHQQLAGRRRCRPVFWNARQPPGRPCARTSRSHEQPISPRSGKASAHGS